VRIVAVRAPTSATLVAEAVAGLVADGLDRSRLLRTLSTSPRRTATADLLHPMPSVVKFISDIRQDLTQDFALATESESGDAAFCNLDSTAAAYATARECSQSIARLQGSDAPERAYGLGVLRECSLPENDPGYVHGSANCGPRASL
jgi:hypothetical protein